MKHETLSQLTAAREQASTRKFPDEPDHGRPPDRLSGTTPKGLARAILIWLELNGYKAWWQSSEGDIDLGSNPTTSWNIESNCQGNTLPGTNKGHSDVQSNVDGLFVAWEVQMMNDEQSRAQQIFQAEVEGSGGKYFVVRTFDEFMRHYRSLTS